MKRRIVLAGLLAAAACAPDPPDDTAPGVEAPVTSLSPTARPEVAVAFREDLVSPRHPADGGGRAWLESGGDVVAGSFSRWSFVYEAGPLGIAVGGAVVFQAPAQWDWSPVQDHRPGQPGYTVATTEAEGVELRTRALSQPRPGLFVVGIAGRDLREGETVRVTYGAGQAGARADSYVDRDSAFWFSVDGDGDGVRGLVPDPPRIDVVAGDPARLVLTVTSTARPGGRVRLTAAILDRTASTGVAYAGELRLTADAEGLALPGSVVFGPGDGARRHLEFRAVSPGTYRIEGIVALRGGQALKAESNPLVVAGDAPPILWGDLHGHSGLSDGTGTPADYFAYARDVAGLDVAVLSDHDHWGVQALDRHPNLWESIEEQVRAFHEPGRFVTISGYEWTSWLHGHRHVLWFEGEGEVFSSIDERYDTPGELWDALAGRDAVTIAHHSAGGPIATNWDWRPDPTLEPVTEVMSVHGSSEAQDSPALIYSPVPGNFVRDVLDDGVRFGFIASGDGHDGHPGLTHLVGRRTGGLAAILTDDLTRDGVLAALRARATYATSGPRIVLRATLDGAPMGAVVSPGGPGLLQVDVAGTAPIASVEVIRGGRGPGRVVAAHPHGGRDLSQSFSLPDLAAGEYVYVRVRQSETALAWSSPFYVGDDDR